VTALFRDVEGATLEGSPQLQSKAILTSELAHEPRQSTELIDGVRTLVVRWSGTVTPSEPGQLDLSVELPVRIRYHDAPAHVAPQPGSGAPDPFDQDPFAGLGFGQGSSIDSFDAMFDRMRQRMMQRMEAPEGPAREEALTLKASAGELDVRALPAEKRPASFSGAVGQFDIDASVSSATAHASEPITLRIVVSGSVDPDRVDLPGVASSDAWKAYAPRIVKDGAPAKGAPRKVFEQVLVPLHGGELTVPPATFSAFDPVKGNYVTKSTHPIVVSVDGAPAAAPPPSPAAPAPEARAAPPSTSPPDGPVAVLSPRAVALRVAPVLAFVLAVALAWVLRRRRDDRSLRRSMRRAASGGDVSSFFRSAGELIATSLSERWGVPPADVTARTIEERLGTGGRPLADVLAAHDTLRFGRGGLEGADPATRRTELGALCTFIEQTLRRAT
jgi:hypothetical protein